MNKIVNINEHLSLNKQSHGVADSSAFDLDRYSQFFSYLNHPPRIIKPTSWAQHIPFAFFAMEILKPRILVELGVHVGNSFTAFCQAREALKLETKCYGVDTWKGDEHAGFYNSSIYYDLKKYIEEIHPKNTYLLRMLFEEALEQIEDKSVDLLHIDGFHTYEAVKNDFLTWLPKMSDRGVILFHDTAVFSGDFGVWKLMEELSKEYNLFSFDHGYGLGVLLVGEDIPIEFVDFVGKAKENSFYKDFFANLGAHAVTIFDKHLLDLEVNNSKSSFESTYKQNINLVLDLVSREKEISKLNSELKEIIEEKNNYKVTNESLLNERNEILSQKSYYEQLIHSLQHSKSWKVLSIIQRIKRIFLGKN